MGVYSFADVTCAINGPGGSIVIGIGSEFSTVSIAGVAEEGISVDPAEDKNTMVTGADGTPMHSLHAGNPGLVTIRLQKTSPINRMLSVMYNKQRSSAAYWGQNTISIRNPVRGDDVQCVECAFKKIPAYNNPKVAPMVEWVFDAGRVNEILGDGQPVAAF
jgi:hypothetical protein